MDVKTRILEAAAELLSRSAEADMSTRAVCDAAGVAAPALYRHFGDKEGLLSAVVDFGFEQFLVSKRAAEASPDPVEDLRTGWDNHVLFAVENPNYYKLMWSPGLVPPPAAAAEAHGMLFDVLERCASQGRLRVSAETATRMIMSAVTGASLSLISRPELFDDDSFSLRLREAVIDSVTVPTGVGATQRAGAVQAATTAPSLPAAAATLDSKLAGGATTALTAPEQALMRQWLTNLADAPDPQERPRDR